MTGVGLVRDELAKIGYSAIVNDYVFSDVFAATPLDRTVSLAAFTHTPPSYRNAALAVVEGEQGEPADVASKYRALGAPLLFVIEGQGITVWQVHPHAPPSVHRRTGLEQLSTLFYENRDLWGPQRIHQAKSFGLMNRSYQLDFVDAGLLPAIEGEIHSKLDRLLNETLSDAVRLRIVRPGEQVDDRLLFRTVFRLLAAKVLEDRRHELSEMWNPSDIDTVLKGISGYYKLPPLPRETGSFKGTIFETAWGHLRNGINFRNISSDDLAFVYENTLVSKETRAHFGTHSTPRPVAEYIVSRLELWRHDLSSMKIYEPFAGAGVFMVAALRLLRDLLPVGMTEPDRHDYLVHRISGDEIEPFATEVAVLSLILADYPNENGWAVSEVDLFKNYALRERAKDAQIVLCNPPFEAFDQEERQRYPAAAAHSAQKPIAALDAILDNRPSALGFVLPEPFIDGRQYEPQRRRLEQMYKEIELVSLPDRIFKASVIRSSLLIAHHARSKDDATTDLRSTVVKVRDRDRFLKTGEVSETRTRTRPQRVAFGHLWVEELAEVWEYLTGFQRLESISHIHRGIEWEGEQSAAINLNNQEGYSPGIHGANAVHAFSLDDHIYLKSSPDSFRKRTAAYTLPWQAPKILANAARISRGPWCFAAAVDHRGLLASQQLFGIWLRNHPTDLSLNALCAILNNPVAVAYVSSHSPPDRIRVTTMKAIPIPAKIPPALDELVERYLSILRPLTFLFVNPASNNANKALADIDAAILEAYDLPPRLERGVLEYFRGDKRPTLHPWTDWYPEEFTAFIPLHRYLSNEFKVATSGWALDVFKPLPENEAAALRDYLD